MIRLSDKTYKKMYNFLGPYILTQALKINRNHIKIDNTKDYDDYNINYFNVTEEISDYNVAIVSNYEEVFNVECNCSVYKRTGRCKHIGAVLINYYEDSAEEEPEDKSLILFDLLTKENKLKGLKLLPVFEFNQKRDYVILKLKIGIDKLYYIGNKLSSFDRSYEFKDDLVVFGKDFIFDGSKFTFSEDDEKIYNLYKQYVYANNYSEYRFALLDKIKLDNILLYLKDKKIEIVNYGRSIGCKEGNPLKVNLEMVDNNYEFRFDIDKINFLDYENNYYFDNGLYKIDKEIAKVVTALKEENVKKIILDEEKALTLNKKINKNFKDTFIIEEKLKEKFEIAIPKVKLYLDYKDKIICDIHFIYKDEVDYFDKIESYRNEEYEKEIYEDILSFGFIYEDNSLIINNIAKIVEFYEELLLILEKKYEIFTTNKFKGGAIVKDNHIKSQFSIGKDNILKYNFDLGEITDKDLNKLFESMKNKERYFKLKSGKIIDTNNKDIKDLKDIMEFLDAYELNGTVPKYRALYLDSIKELNIVKTDETFDNFIKNFYENKSSKIKINDSILRDYQKTGVSWLYNIYKTGFGGILADEMGLGKTIQTIYFIKEVIKENKDAKVLIVTPTSLVYNWLKEFDMFGSELNYVLSADNKSKRIEILNSDSDIFITSYGMLRQDSEEYLKKEYDLIIIDEAQNIKNPKAGISIVLKSLNSKCKIALTGTPVENSILEVWSIFDFIMPGFLNSLSKFQNRFNFKEMDEDSHDKLAVLSKLIKPFILRRRKKDVLSDLPDKMEQNIFYDLPESQKQVYAMQVKKSREEFEDLMAKEGYLKARFKILQLLTKLRQICINPTLVFDNYEGEAIKYIEIINLINSYKENGHKMLIFSSFKSTLIILKTILKENGVSFYSIDGTVKSKERNDLVEAFNKDNTDVFLITLKAGGTGLNLTGADVVIHLDLWWNPQVENQATDRAHRIGQKNNVEVIKMVCKGTIEEKILELQEKKKILNDKLIDSDKKDEIILSKLTESDIRNLLMMTE